MILMKWKHVGGIHWRLVRSPIYAWLWSAVALVAVSGSLLICQVLGITDMPITRIFCYGAVFGLGNRLGWYRMED